MTWTHERGINPLEAASRTFSAEHRHVRINWDSRSLKDFEAFPLEELANTYDLLMIDHPHIGSACAQNLLSDLDSLLDRRFLIDQRANSVGRSYESYSYNQKQWALPVDAAAQVCAYRADLLPDGGLPQTWGSVDELARILEPGYHMAVPFVPVHAFATFFTLSSQIGSQPFWSNDQPLERETGRQVLFLIAKLLSASHPISFESDPIAILDLMGRGDSIAYAPLVYGYSNYSREGFRTHTVRFGDIPSETGLPEGSMLGGVGLAISSRCAQRETASAFVKMVASADYQRGEFFTSGGQPGHRSAWTDDAINARSSGFFRNTLATLDAGSIRPRFDGYVGFQEEAGAAIRSFIMENRKDTGRFVDELNRGFFAARDKLTTPQPSGSPYQGNS